MRFNYQARTKTGKIQAGIVEALNKEAALSLLQKNNLYITFLEEVKSSIFQKRIGSVKKVSFKELMAFTRQLAILFKANVPPVESFHAIAAQIKNINFKEKIIKIAESIEGGANLSGALNRYPKVFSWFYISMIKSGEASGNLPEVIDFLAEHLEREHSLRSKVKGAMIYPAFVFIVFLIIMGFMVVFVLPQLTMVVVEADMDVPWVTLFMMGLFEFLKKWGWIIIIAIVISVTFVFRHYRTEEGRKFFDKLFLKIPIVGPIIEKVCLTRFAENLSTLISGGLPISKALEITGEVVGNDVYKNIIAKTEDGVRKGEKMSSVLQRYPTFISPLFVQMTMIGERTGKLDDSLDNVVEYYRKEVDRSIDGMVGILEPLLIVLLGGIVGMLVASVLLPLYQMGAI